MKSGLLQGPKIFFPPQAYEETILQKMMQKALQQTNAIHIPGTYKRYTECKGLHKTAFNKSIFNWHFQKHRQRETSICKRMAGRNHWLEALGYLLFLIIILSWTLLPSIRLLQQWQYQHGEGGSAGRREVYGTWDWWVYLQVRWGNLQQNRKSEFLQESLLEWRLRLTVERVKLCFFINEAELAKWIQSLILVRGKGKAASAYV